MFAHNSLFFSYIGISIVHISKSFSSVESTSFDKRFACRYMFFSNNSVRN
nr:MAG TPA: hypothetical protein [Caudoviricetes sp.]